MQSSRSIKHHDTISNLAFENSNLYLKVSNVMLKNYGVQRVSYHLELSSKPIINMIYNFFGYENVFAII